MCMHLIGLCSTMLDYVYNVAAKTKPGFLGDHFSFFFPPKSLTTSLFHHIYLTGNNEETVFPSLLFPKKYEKIFLSVCFLGESF